MTSRKQELAHLASLMEKIDIAMLTTVGAGGYLVSRPLSTQAATFDGERVWFFTEADSPKVAELRRHAKVNLAYSSKDANTYLSAAGDAAIVRDRAVVHRFWSDALKAFFPKGPDDPNLVLIEVRLRTVEYWDGPGSWLGKAATYLVARLTGNDEAMGENRIIEVDSGRSRKPATARGRKQATGGKTAGKQATRGGAATTASRAARPKKAPAKRASAKSGRAAGGRTGLKRAGTRTATTRGTGGGGRTR